MRYSLDGGELQDYTGGFSMSADGVHTVEAHAADGSTKTVGFAIDTTDPTVAMTTPAPGARRRPRPRLDSSCQLRLRRRGLGRAVVYGESCVGPAARPELGRNEDDLCHGHRRRRRSFTLTRTYEVVYRDILFSSSRTGHGDIYAIGAGGGTPGRLTSHSAIEAEPAWSPDRSRIAFTSTRDGNFELYLLEVATGDVTRLTTHPAIDTSPAFSPTARRSRSRATEVQAATGTST